MKILFTLCLLLFFSSPAAAGATPLCAANTPLIPAAPGLSPFVSSWSLVDSAGGKISPDCTRMASRDHKLNIALAGSFRFAGTEQELLAKFGAISSLGGLQYYSWSDRKRETLIKKASAIDAKTRQPRGDFTGDEMKPGSQFYFAQNDNRSSTPVIYRMTVETVEPEKAVIRVENVSKVKFLMMTVYNPGDIQSVYVLEKQAGGIWSYFNLVGIDTRVTLMGGNPALSATARAEAMFAHYAGMEQKPQPAR